MRIILARCTSKYGNVYFAALRLNSRASSADRSMRNGLLLDMREPSLRFAAKMPYVSGLINHNTLV